MTLPPLYLTRPDTVVLVLQFVVTQAEHSLSQSVSLSRHTTGHGPLIHSVVHVFGLLVFSKLFVDFVVHQLQKRLPSGMAAMCML